MKVVVETNLDFGWKWKTEENEAEPGDTRPAIKTMLQEGKVELGGARPTLRVLLQALSREYSKGKVTFIDPETNEVDPDEYMVTVNGKAWEFLPQRLDTELNEDDRVSVSIWLELLGGG